MADMVKVKVLRHQLGDEAYEPGDTRELSKADAERLAATGAVQIVDQAKSKAKKAPALQNKKEPAPTNKAAPATGSK